MTAVAVLGQGRMGRAMSARLADVAEVRSWGRSSGTSPRDAVADASVVVLALFDAAACHDVLTGLDGALGAGTTVANTTTVAPDEAEQLAAEVAATGASYVHAPVMGSTPAVRSGGLIVLAGAAQVGDDVRDVLERLGDVVPCGTPRAAAALKLVANSVLAGSLLTLQQALVLGDRLDLDRAALLDVLTRTALGGLVGGKRPVLEDPDTGQDTDQFALDALVKDLALLERASSSGPRTAQAVRESQRSQAWPGSADVGLLALPPLPLELDAEAHLSLGADVHGPAEALAPLASYARGHATGDPGHFRDAFLPTAHVEGYRDGAFTSWPLTDYCALFDGPAADEGQRHRVVESLDVRGPVGTAVMTLHHGETVFTDMFVLVADGAGTWRIANKVYAREVPSVPSEGLA